MEFKYLGTYVRSVGSDVDVGTLPFEPSYACVERPRSSGNEVANVQKPLVFYSSVTRIRQKMEDSLTIGFDKS